MVSDNAFARPEAPRNLRRAHLGDLEPRVSEPRVLGHAFFELFRHGESLLLLTCVAVDSTVWASS